MRAAHFLLVLAVVLAACASASESPGDAAATQQPDQATGQVAQSAPDLAGAPLAPDTGAVAGAPSAPPATVPPAAPAPSAPAPPAVAPPVPGLRGGALPAPTPVSDPAALAAEILATETEIRDGTTALGALTAVAERQQIAYRSLVLQPDLVEPVVARLPAALGPVVRANAGAGMELAALITQRRDLPAWLILAPAPAEDLMSFYMQGEAQFGVPWEYLAAIHLVETRMGRIRGTSTAGAQGPMQFIPSTWAAFGEGDINDNHDAIIAAARYLASRGAPGNMERALHAYNNSQRYVRAVTAYAEQIMQNPRAYGGYYHWQVFYAASSGDAILPVGYRG